MRSVVVVLPASMWAMMPMFRVFSSEYCRSTSLLFFLLPAALDGHPGPRAPSPCGSRRAPSLPYRRRGGSAVPPPSPGVAPLPAIVSERFVGLRHLVGVFSLLHRGAPVVGGVEQLGGELLGHAALGPAPGRPDDPAHGQRGAAFRTDLD